MRLQTEAERSQSGSQLLKAQPWGAVFAQGGWGIAIT